MFENPDSFKDAVDQAGGTTEGLQLRAFSWSELSARFAAARDARVILQKAGSRNGGSFLSAASRAPDHHVQLPPADEGSINLVGLSDSKATPALCADAASDAAHVDRETL